jgi:hypothetical protein
MYLVDQPPIYDKLRRDNSLLYETHNDKLIDLLLSPTGIHIYNLIITLSN